MFYCTRDSIYIHHIYVCALCILCCAKLLWFVLCHKSHIEYIKHMYKVGDMNEPQWSAFRNKTDTVSQNLSGMFKCLNSPLCALQYICSSHSSGRATAVASTRKRACSALTRAATNNSAQSCARTWNHKHTLTAVARKDGKSLRNGTSRWWCICHCDAILWASYWRAQTLAWYAIVTKFEYGTYHHVHFIQVLMWVVMMFWWWYWWCRWMEHGSCRKSGTLNTTSIVIVFKCGVQNSTAYAERNRNVWYMVYSRDVGENNVSLLDTLIDHAPRSRRRGLPRKTAPICE